MKGLVVDEPWISLIISGEKTWEMRSRNTLVRGRIALIRKGSKTVIGTADLVRTLPKWCWIRCARWPAGLCGADLGGIATRQGHVYRFAATFGQSPDFDAVLRQQSHPPGRGKRPRPMLWTKTEADALDKIMPHPGKHATQTRGDTGKTRH